MSKVLDRVLEIVGCEDTEYDPWGSYMAAFFTVAEVLDMADVVGNETPEVFERWAYGPSPFVAVADIETVAARIDDFSEGEWADDFEWGAVALSSAVVEGEVTIEDLIYVGDVLCRVVDKLKHQGRSY